MKLLATLLLACQAISVFAQIEDEEIFGRMEVSGREHHLRFFASWDQGRLFNLSYAPHGFQPLFVENLRADSLGYRFRFRLDQQEFDCHLSRRESAGQHHYQLMNLADSSTLKLQLANSNAYCRFGADLKPSVEDLRILDRAEELLGGGKSWCQECDRHCNRISYPFRWSLFCALHQASVELQAQYLENRPLMQAVRLAINELQPEQSWQDPLRDFNLAATEYEAIQQVLSRSREMLMLRIASGARSFSDYEGPPVGYTDDLEEPASGNDSEGSW